MNVASKIRITLPAICLVNLLVTILLVGGARGQVPEPNLAAPAKTDSDLDRLITKLVLESIPHTFTDTKKWGQQAERFDGFKRERNGLKLRVSKRKKMVNHGDWKKYSVSLRDTEEKFAIAVKDMRELPNNSVGFNVEFLADLNVSGRQSKWVKGVHSTACPPMVMLRSDCGWRSS